MDATGGRATIPHVSSQSCTGIIVYTIKINLVRADKNNN